MLKISDIICDGYEEFWKDRHKYRVMKGGKGSAKSSTTALNFITRIMKYPDSNLLVVRAVFNTHKDSTYAQLKWAINKLGVDDLWRCTTSPLEMTYKPTGQKIIFRGFDDVLKLASTTVAKGYLCWVWVEEAFEISTEADFEKLELSVARSDVPAPLFNQFTILFNPWSETHWLKKRFFDSSSELISTYTTDYRQNRFLGADYIKTMEEMKKTNYRKYSVAGLGEWGIAEGLIFENWEILEFDINSKGEPVPCNGYGDAEDLSWQYKHLFGLDYGYTNDPTAFVALAANPISKEIYIYDEHYERKMLNTDIANMIMRKGFAKERIRADCAEPKSNEDLRRLGLGRIVSSAKGKDSIINGITYLQEFKIFVKPSCVNMIMELSSYCWKKDKNENGINKPEDKDNHLCDALRYAIYDLRFFHPQDPKIKHRPTAEQIYNKNHSVNSTDFSGGWE